MIYILKLKSLAKSILPKLSLYHEYENLLDSFIYIALSIIFQ